MAEKETDLFGIPVPSDDKLFLTFVVIHIVVALLCVVSGLVAMLSEKTKKNHPLAGKLYFRGMLFAFITIVILAVMRWPHNNHLLVIGIFSMAFAYTGRRLTQTRPKKWTRLHTVCMGSSYILLLTGFYVDNGKNLPFWKLFPQFFFWIFPAMVGLPIIFFVLKRHPLNRS